MSGQPLPKEFRVTMRLRNNRLLSLREERGMTGQQVADAIGISYVTYVGMEGLRLSPKKKNGEWKATACKIAEFFRLTPDLLWPDMVLRVVDPVVSTELDGRQMATMLPQATEIAHGLPAPDPFEALFSAERKQRLEAAMWTLTPMERKVIEYRMEGKTLLEIGERYHLGRERIRQLEAGALRKLRECLEEPKSPWKEDNR